MNKEKYRDLRKNSNFVFLYYLERGGYIKDEPTFQGLLKQWFIGFGENWRSGILRITKHLDEKYQYVKKK